jgi:predicted dehydrogenase
MTESKQLRLGIIGCGAISEQGHLPALKTLGIKPALLVDVDLPRTERLAKQFRAAAVAPALKPEHFDAIDAAIVATPPLHHGPVCIELLRRGKHVLVEKPMTIAVDEARAVVAAAEQGKAVLGVGYVHRFSHVRQWAHALVKSGRLGQIRRFDIREGHVYDWPLKSDSMWRREQSGGGVLIDGGTHIFDTMAWMFGEVASVDYRDDSYGGVEADCIVELKMKSGATGVIELSRSRFLRNTIRIEGTAGHVEFNIVQFNKVVDASPELLSFEADGVTPATMPTNIVLPDLFVKQLSLWLKAIETGGQPPVTGRDGLTAVELVARCYAVRRPWELPWVQPDRQMPMRETANA